MRVLFTTSEIYPYVKTGGLGDVSAALPPALKASGVDIRLMLPGYAPILEQLEDVQTLARFPIYFGARDVRLVRGVLPGGLTAYVLDAPGFYASRIGPYVDSSGIDWDDNHYRFAALSRISADLGEIDTEWQPEIIHAHDWPGGLIPAYLRFKAGPVPKSVITIHNIAYQGLFPSYIMPLIGLPPEAYTPEGVEFYDKVGYLKAGLAYADHITTVSPTYAREIQDEEQGCGLDGILRARADVLTGILNGIDTKVWDPQTDPALTTRYKAASLGNRDANKMALLQKFSLDASTDRPLYAVVSRLGPQKGLDLLLRAAPHLLQLGGNLFVLGSGDKGLETAFRDLETRFPGRVRIVTAYDEALAHQLQGAADVMMMPSRSEPCGLVQMYAMRYGALPLVRATGGLADTVSETAPSQTGFVFTAPTPRDLEAALARSATLYQDKTRWRSIQKRAMEQDFSWDLSAAQYARLYQNLLDKRTGEL